MRFPSAGRMLPRLMSLGLMISGLGLAGTPQAAAADSGKAGAKTPNEVAAVAGRLWDVSELVLVNHLDPPARQELLLAATRAAVKAAQGTPGRELGRDVSAVTTRDQFARFFEQALPGACCEEATPSAADPLQKVEAEALAALVAAVPGQASLISAADRRLAEQISGNRYVGTGIQIRWDEREGLSVIVNPFPRGPMRKAGGKPGDRILEVDGRSAKAVGLQTVIGWLRGPVESVVTVVVRQPGEKETRTLKVTRDVIPFETVLGFRRLSEEAWDYRADPSSPVGYVWINSINAATLHDLRRAEEKMRAAGIKALVIDLRFSNGQGQLHHAELLADGLLDGGLMWRVRDPRKPVQDYRADPECLFRGWPLVVLVNENVSDNAQGAVIAALQDNGRAVVVGAPASGDGLVRDIFPLPGGGGLICPVGRLERAAPKQGWPVKPDHAVAVDRKEKRAIERWLRQKELPDVPAGKDEQPSRDPQLSKALALLREVLKSNTVSQKSP